MLRLAGRDQPFRGRPVRDVMTTRLAVVSPDDDILAAARLMGERRIRHLPVIEGENLLGMVGIRDVLGVLAERIWRDHDGEARATIRDLAAR